MTDSTGAYTIPGLVSGTYVVRENLPSSYISTGPALSNDYTVALTAGANSTGNDFDDFRQLNTSVISNINYTINGAESESDLRGNTNQGDLVQVTFTVAANVTNFPLSLVSYTAPAATFDATTAAQQQIFELDAGTFSTGTYTLTVTLPNSYYQVDFVAGAAIDTFGPANSNIFYLAENRLFSADNDGTQAVATALNVYASTSSLGGSAAASYGFQVTASGLGASYFGVENDGQAFGVANNTLENVWSLLLAVNSRSSAGKLLNGNTTLRSLAQDLFGDLN